MTDEPKTTDGDGPGDGLLVDPELIKDLDPEEAAEEVRGGVNASGLCSAGGCTDTC